MPFLKSREIVLLEQKMYCQFDEELRDYWRDKEAIQGNESTSVEFWAIEQPKCGVE